MGRTRALLEQARLKNPKAEEAWLAGIRTEQRAGNTKAAEAVMAKALQVGRSGESGLPCARQWQHNQLMLRVAALSSGTARQLRQSWPGLCRCINCEIGCELLCTEVTAVLHAQHSGRTQPSCRTGHAIPCTTGVTMTSLWAGSAQLLSCLFKSWQGRHRQPGLAVLGGSSSCCAPKQQELPCSPCFLSAALLWSAASAAQLLSQPANPLCAEHRTSQTAECSRGRDAYAVKWTHRGAAALATGHLRRLWLWV